MSSDTSGLVICQSIADSTMERAVSIVAVITNSVSAILSVFQSASVYSDRNDTRQLVGEKEISHELAGRADRPHTLIAVLLSGRICTNDQRAKNARMHAAKGIQSTSVAVSVASR